MTTLYSTAGVAETSGATYRQIHHWTEQEALRPCRVAGGGDKGTGHHRVYDEREVEVAKIMRVLLSLDIEEAGRVARAVADGRSAHLPFGVEVRGVAIQEATR